MSEYSVDFPKADQEICNVPTYSALSPSSTVSVNLWAKVEAGDTPDSSWSHFCGKSDGGTSVDWGFVWAASDEHIEFRVNAGGNESDAETTDTWDDTDGWTMWTATYDSNFIRLYKDGVEVSEVGQNGTIQQSGSDFGIGGHADAPDRAFPGKITNVSVYSSALTQAQIDRLYAGGTVATNRVGYWPFTEGNGTNVENFEKSVGSATDGTLSGGYSWTTDIPPAANRPPLSFEKSHAIDFPGAAQENAIAKEYDDITTTSMSSGFSISCWVRFNSGATPSPNWSHLFGKSDTSTSADYGLVWSDDGGSIRFRVDTDVDTFEVLSDDTYDSNDGWIHVVGVVDGGPDFQRLYINGDEQSDVNNPDGNFIDSGNGNIHIGGHADADNRWLDGDVADPRIYRVELTPEQIGQLYRGNHVSTGLVGWWPMAEGDGGIITNKAQYEDANAAILSGGYSWITDTPPEIDYKILQAGSVRRTRSSHETDTNRGSANTFNPDSDFPSAASIPRVQIDTTLNDDQIDFVRFYEDTTGDGTADNVAGFNVFPDTDAAFDENQYLLEPFFDMSSGNEVWWELQVSDDTDIETALEQFEVSLIY